MGPPRQLVLRALGLGDLLVAVPALRALKRDRPGWSLVLAAPAALGGLAAATGAVDELLPTPRMEDLRWPHEPPARAVNLHGRGPQSHHVLDATDPAERVGFRSPGWDGPSWVDVETAHAHERERWCALLDACGIATDPADLRLPAPAAAGAGPVVVVHPGAAFGSKRWPADRFAAVAAELERTAPVVLTGSAGERPLACAVAAAARLPEERVLAGRTDLDELAAVVAGARLVVSGDTGIAHLASAFGTPSVVLFGPVPATRWGPPRGGPHVALCRDELRRGEPFADDPDPALLGVTVAAVLTAARRVCPP